MASIKEPLIIFERSLFTGNTDTNAKVSLTSTITNELLNCIPRAMSVTQSIGMLSPLVIVTFNDINGDLFNHLKPDMADVFTLKFIRSDSNQVEMKLKIINVEYTGTVVGATSNIEFRVTFMGESWYEMTAAINNRGWNDTLFSDVVKDVVSVGKFRETKIHATSNKAKSIIQPHNTNLDFLKWIKLQSFSNTVDGHYAFGVNYDNQFFFKNIAQHIIDYRPRMRNDEVITFKLMAPEDNANDAIQSKINNNQVPAYFVGVSGQTDYSDTVRSKASGGSVGYVDFTTGAYKTKAVSIGELDAPMLSDKASLHTMHAKNKNFCFYGTDASYDKKEKTRLSEEAFNAMTLKILTEGSPNISIFDLVYVDINNTNEQTSSIKNLIHSGYYIVKNAVTTFSFEETVSMTTGITLARHGYNTNNIDDFSDMVETKRGKI
ncbi:hypothetical protein [Alishewanella phage vB_AspM_Slicko01]|nr:hypothetical protein [Alishewanella phage vB_AspM_Slicko01]